MAYRAIEPIIEDELEIDNDLLRFYYRVIQALTENRLDVIDDDLLQKLVEVRLAMDPVSYTHLTLPTIYSV